MDRGAYVHDEVHMCAVAAAADVPRFLTKFLYAFFGAKTDNISRERAKWSQPIVIARCSCASWPLRLAVFDMVVISTTFSKVLCRWVSHLLKMSSLTPNQTSQVYLIGFKPVLLGPLFFKVQGPFGWPSMVWAQVVVMHTVRLIHLNLSWYSYFISAMIVRCVKILYILLSEVADWFLNWNIIKNWTRPWLLEDIYSFVKLPGRWSLYNFLNAYSSQSV
jgi:hypothetical protein